MITRRRMLLSLTSTGLLTATAVASTQCTPTPAPAAEPDPALVAIQAHREAREAFLALDEADAGYASADDAEWEAWLRFTQTPPTTPRGIAAMASYLERTAHRDAFDVGDQFRTALLNLALGAAAVAA